VCSFIEPSDLPATSVVTNPFARFKWRDQGKRDEARDLLARLYGWFTEGFNTLDLKEAKALLDALASCGADAPRRYASTVMGFTAETAPIQLSYRPKHIRVDWQSSVTGDGMTMNRHADHHVNEFGEGRHDHGCGQHQHESEHLGREEGVGCCPQDGHADVSGGSGFVGGEFAGLGMAHISPASLVGLLFEALIHNGAAQGGAPLMLDAPNTITEVSAPITIFANDQIEGSVSIDSSQHTQNYVHDAFPGIGPTTITEVSAPITIFANDQIEGSVSIDSSQHAQNYVDGLHSEALPAQGGAPLILDGPTTITEVSAPISVFANDQIEGPVSIDNSQHTQNYVHDAFPGIGPTTITEISAPITIFANDQIEGSVSIDSSQHAQNYVDGSHYLFGLV
jgi:hypothetical protein